MLSNDGPDVVVDAHNLLATSLKSVDGQEATLDAAEAATQALVNTLFALPVERSDVGPIASLPPSVTALPRRKPVPKPKAETKWEAFAKTKGIQKKKQSRMVWDETKNQWAPAWGYKRKGDDDDEAIIEMNESDIMADPRVEKAEAKKDRVAANAKQRQANERRAAKQPAPEAEKKNGESKKRKTDEALPVGVPVDLDAPKEKKRGKKSVDAALVAVQKSTASLGKFDAPRDGEKKQKERGKKRQFAPVTTSRGVAAEVDHNMKLLNDLLRPQAKAPKKGHAELMDTHDGELPVDFKRKKGKIAGGKHMSSGTQPSSSKSKKHQKKNK